MYDIFGKSGSYCYGARTMAYSGVTEYRAGKTRVIVFKHGLIGSPTVFWVLNIIREAYMKGESPEILELHFYQDSSMLQTVVEELGYSPTRIENIVSHEALKGKPRLHIALRQGIYALYKSEAEAIIAHEAMHAILHNTPQYYQADSIMQLIALSILRDLEANQELLRRGLRKHLYGLQALWLYFHEGQLRCTTALETIESLHAITAWTPLNKMPPISSECEEKVIAIITLLPRLGVDKPLGSKESAALLSNVLQQVLNETPRL